LPWLGDRWAYDRNALPLVTGFAVLSTLSLALVTIIERRRSPRPTQAFTLRSVGVLLAESRRVVVSHDLGGPAPPALY